MDETSDDLVAGLAARLGLLLGPRLPARSNESWRARRNGESLLLRRHRNKQGLDHSLLGQDLEWQASIRTVAADRGWPAPEPVLGPFDHSGSWWTLEHLLDGEHRHLPASEHAALIVRWRQTEFPWAEVGPRPGAVDHLAILDDEDGPAILDTCLDCADRDVLLRRFDQATALAEGIDWSASPIVLVHGDLVSHNLLWSGNGLTGVLDFELADVTRRVRELILTWRCRYDNLVHAVDRIAPLNDHEWRMLLVDWWAQALTLAAQSLRQDRQPDQCELGALRRESSLSHRLGSIRYQCD